MSDTYFCFSDENGDYKKDMTEKQLSSHPFYVRTTFLMNAGEWKKLNLDFRSLKNKYGIPTNKEIKWSFLWSLRHYKKSGKVIPIKKDFKFFEMYDYHELISFVEECLGLIHGINEKKIIISFTINNSGRAIIEKRFLAMHLQEHMQRIEMELNHDQGNLGVLFFDPVSTEKNEMFKEVYADLFENGDFIQKYSCIKDSLIIENSHQSVGIQIADYISGSFSALLKSDSGDYSLGIKMFNENVKPYLRKYYGTVFGYGIREVPQSPNDRDWIRDKIKKHP